MKIKSTFKKYPYSSKMLLAIPLFFAAIVLTGIIEKLVPIKIYFPFTGMFLLLLVTWILYRFENQKVSQLGLNINARNTLFFLFGMLIGVLAYAVAKMLKSFYTGESTHFNPAFDINLMMMAIYYLLPMVAVEELLYRGYLFKKTVDRSSVLIANIVFATIFMLIHVLDSEVLSSLGKIVFYTVTIPIGHLMFATALLKSKTLWFPIGIHLGNNWSTRHLFSENSSTQSIFYTTGSNNFETWGEFIPFLIIWNGFYLIVTYAIWKWPKQPENYGSM